MARLSVRAGVKVRFGVSLLRPEADSVVVGRRHEAHHAARLVRDRVRVGVGVGVRARVRVR
eukprot:scaffold72563_cov60-Phaeocystis_antarctica.AAC.1